MFVDDALIGRRLLTSKALAGYMETAAGRPLVIAFFINGVVLEARGEGAVPTTTDAGKHLGRLCEAFYLGDGPTPPAAVPTPPAADPAPGGG
jgi:D-alanyl-D-alanine carboxypeptidase/D-alanyl-D-alanine-endopeptidase (penicillin-binding protein 4)